MDRDQAEKYTTESLLWMQHWTDHLLSFRLSRPAAFRFSPGQFARLGLTLDNGGQVWRAYSMCSAVTDEYLEFYSIVVPEGQFSSHLVQMQPGQTLMLDKRAVGFFSADRLPDGKDLWLLGTGTGLAPYLAILQDPSVWQRFDQLILVHGTRYANELSYQDFIRQLCQHPLWEEHGHKLRYVPVVTRELSDGALNERIPALLANGHLAQAVQLTMSPEHSRFMICGSPSMVEDTHRQLMKMGYRLSRLTAPGHLVLENGW